MNFVIYDTSNYGTESRPDIADAIDYVETRLRAEESRGRRVQREDHGRWAIYGENAIDLLWIEDAAGSVVSFAR